MPSGGAFTLSAGDSANVSAAGKAVYIGKNAGSNNTLIVADALTATQITVGATGNSGNTLQLGTGGATGTLSPGSVITNNGVVIFNRSDAITQGTHFGSAAISGTGAVTQAGLGNTIFNVSNTYSGATTVSAGTLTVNNNGTTALGRLPNTASVVLNSGGTLLLSGAAAVTDRLNNLAAVTINGGGKLSTGSLSEGAAPTAANGAGGAAGVGALTLSSTSSALRAGIDFGNAGSGSALVFGSSRGPAGERL